MDLIFSLRTILEEYCGFSVDLHILFIDFKWPMMVYVGVNYIKSYMNLGYKEN
jgi:hypothetical protein